MAAPGGYTLVGGMTIPKHATIPGKGSKSVQLSAASSMPTSPAGKESKSRVEQAYGEGIGGGVLSVLGSAGDKAPESTRAEISNKVQSVDKKNLSIDLLLVGYVQSYIDFFYISHRKPQTSGFDDVGDSGSNGDTGPDVNIPEETLTFLKETLESAETARRQKNFHHCFEHYNLLSDYFEKINDLKGAKYFYERCATVATEVNAQESVAKAKVSLGTVEEKAKNWQGAMKYHEEALEIAVNHDAPLGLQMKISARLTHVYFVLAEQCEQEGDDLKANEYYRAALSSAQKTKDTQIEGVACHLLGKSYYKLKNYSQAIALQEEYLDICRQLDDHASEAMARGALAKCYEATGEIAKSIRELETLLNVASVAGEFHAQAGACLNLGLLYHSRNEYDKSVALLKQHFDLAQQLGDRKLIDSARVILGMARGNGKLDLYATLVNTDMDKLLKWKAKRVPLSA